MRPRLPLLALLVAWLVGAPLTHAYHDDVDLSPCIEQILEDGLVPVARIEELSRIGDHCYRVAYNEGLIGDFYLRRMAFLQQNYSDGVILWMVVALTASGVLLAALQLAATYRLSGSGGSASLNDQSEITLERGKVVIRSSIVGIMILFISFAFFYVFVLYVYRIEEVNVDRNQSAASRPPVAIDRSAGATFLPGRGGLGHPTPTADIPVPLPDAEPPPSQKEPTSQDPP